MKRIRIAVRNLSWKLERLGLDFQESMNVKAFSTKPFERPGSKNFILLVKRGEYTKVKYKLMENKWFVYDFDVVITY